MHIHICSHYIIVRLNKHGDGRDTRRPPPLTTQDSVDIIYSTHVCTDGDKCILGLERVRKFPFARHLSVLYNKNSNYGKLIVL